MEACRCCGFEMEEEPEDNICPCCNSDFDGEDLGMRCPHCGFSENDPEGCDFCIPPEYRFKER